MTILETHKRTTKRQSVFEYAESLGVSINAAAQQTGVSTATIRNWVKTGYLRLAGKGRISEESFNQFLSQLADSNKLTSRANKSLKDTHDHADLSSKYLLKLSLDGGKSEEIANDYEACLSDSFRNREGIYYTPPEIVSDLFKQPTELLLRKTFCDPCCGSGNFILRAIELGFKPENVFGYDTDPIAVAITKKRILERTGYDSNNIIHANFLEVASNSNGLLFDYIHTNPPWGKKITKEEKEKYGVIFGTGKSTDTCSLFFFACLKCLSVDGEIGLLLPESFFNIATFEAARLKSLSLNIQRLIDYDKPFKGLVSKAFAMVLKNQIANSKNKSIVCESNNSRHVRSAQSFKENPKLIFNFQCDPHDSDVIEHLFSLPHITLEEHAKWGLGIVTGNNEKFFQARPAPGYIPVFKGSDIKIDGLTDPSCFIPADLSIYQQVAPIELFQAKGKLIYKFISSNLCFYWDTRQRYILNSANMLIPDNDFPLSGEQLCSLLNSNILNWLFKTLFKTHKILRSDLESLPIHSNYFKKYNVFDEELFLRFIHLEKTNYGTYRIKK